MTVFLLSLGGAPPTVVTRCASSTSIPSSTWRNPPEGCGAIGTVPEEPQVNQAALMAAEGAASEAVADLVAEEGSDAVDSTAAYMAALGAAREAAACSVLAPASQHMPYRKMPTATAGRIANTAKKATAKACAAPSTTLP